MFQALTLMSAGVPGLAEVVGRFLVIAVGPPTVMARLTIAARYLRNPATTSRGVRRMIRWIFFAMLVVGGIFVAVARPDIPIELPRVLTVAGIGLVSAVLAALISPGLHPPARLCAGQLVCRGVPGLVVRRLGGVRPADAAIRAATSVPNYRRCWSIVSGTAFLRSVQIRLHRDHGLASGYRMARPWIDKSLPASQADARSRRHAQRWQHGSITGSAPPSGGV